MRWQLTEVCRTHQSLDDIWTLRRVKIVGGNGRAILVTTRACYAQTDSQSAQLAAALLLHFTHGMGDSWAGSRGSGPALQETMEAFSRHGGLPVFLTGGLRQLKCTYGRHWMSRQMRLVEVTRSGDDDNRRLVPGNPGLLDSSQSSLRHRQIQLRGRL